MSLMLRRLRPVFILSIALLAFGGLLPISPAHADPEAQPAAEPAAEPATVTADALPTAQINGVVWDQVVVGETVYAAGSFTSARPAGSALGENESARGNLVAYNITTGELLDWAPKANGTVYSITASPDGSTLYLGGQFTTLNGENTYRVGAVKAGTGARVPLGVGTNSLVQAVELSPDGNTLYLGGSFTQVNSSSRQRVAAFDLTTRTVTGFAPAVANHVVRAIAAATDGSAVAIGGSFTSVNGSSQPGFGLAILETDGSLRMNNVNNVVRNATNVAGIMSLEADEQGLYGTAYSMSRQNGSIEGMFRADWGSGDLVLLADCHGDTYDVFPTSEVLYITSHTHDCANIGGMPDSVNYNHGLAFTNAATGTVGPNVLFGYNNHEGQPAPSLLNFYPQFAVGRATNTNQATWTVEGNADYVVYGGEFPSVNGTPQQGLVRFARRDLAPNAQGPMIKGGAYKTSVRTSDSGHNIISFPINWDRDDKTLTYKVYRDTTASAPVSTQTVSASFWEQRQLSATDVVEPGSTHRYRVVVTDPWGNWTHSDWISVTAAGDNTQNAYTQRVLRDGASAYWTMDETSGAAVADATGQNHMTIQGAAYARGTDPAILTGASLTLRNNGFASYAASSLLLRAPSEFSTEAWFQTTSSWGGIITSFGSAKIGQSTNRDRVLYMRNNGTLAFSLNPGSIRSVVSPAAYNDGQWHHAVVTVSRSGGTTMYVDGELVASDASMNLGRSFSGFWRVGGDSTSGLPAAPWSGYFSGAIDEVAIYGSVLSPEQVFAHHAAGVGMDPADGGLGGGNQDPEPADPEPVDPQPVDPEPVDPQPVDPEPVDPEPVDPQPVDPEPVDPEPVDPEPQPDENVLVTDAFDRTTTRGWGSADKGGNWTVAWGTSRFSTAESSGRISLTGAGSSASISSPVIDSTSTDAVMDMTFDAMPSGNGVYVTYRARSNESGAYDAEVRLAANGAVTVTVSKTVAGKKTVLGTGTMEGTYEAGQPLHLRVVVDGAESTTVRSRVWTGDTEPEAWLVDTVDDDAALAAAGSVGFTTYTSASAGQDAVNLLIGGLTVRRVA